MALTLGVDVAIRAAHQATLARDGVVVWRGRKFFTRPVELERLWAELGLEDPAELTVVLEPTSNSWIVVAEWFRRRGAKVVMVPTTQSSDLRKYYSKQPRMTGSIRSFWPGCRSCTPKVCAPTPDRARPTRCGG